MKCPKCGRGEIVANVTVTRAIPLAKGGGLNLMGVTVTQADLRAAHAANLIEEGFVNRSQEQEPHYEVFCNNEGSEETVQIVMDENGNDVEQVIPAVAFCAAEFWYFPSYKEGKPGRGLTLPQGKAIKGAAKAEGAPAEDPNEGMIPAEEDPKPAAPVAPVARPAITAPVAMRRRPVVVARRA